MLHQVNLLPWRDEIRAQHKKRFINLVVLGTLVAVIAQWMVGNYFHEQKSHQQARLNYLQQYIAQLDTQIQSLKVAEEEHKSILTRLDVVESLQSGRNKTTEFMNLMPNLVPEGVYVDKIKMNGQEIEMSGISDSTARLATMLDNLERSDSLSDVEMHSIVHNKKRFNKEFQTFKVSFMFTPLSLQNPIESDATTVRQSLTEMQSIWQEQYISKVTSQLELIASQEVLNG
ncbi:PilN domain-containing protein [Vibrio sp. 99-70-13A1]|nr:PilN domain-containing protein [Vibrio sp. 99-70-13A1]